MRLTVALSYEAYDSRLAAQPVGLGRAERLDTSTRVPDSMIWYRTLDVDSAEANVLEGVEEILIEPDRLLGLRGIRRSMAYPEAFHAELEGVARARAKGAISSSGPIPTLTRR